MLARFDSYSFTMYRLLYITRVYDDKGLLVGSSRRTVEEVVRSIVIFVRPASRAANKLLSPMISLLSASIYECEFA